MTNNSSYSSEYVSKYNVGEDVPYSTYTWSEGEQTVIGSGSRGGNRPFAELLVAHYSSVRGLDAGWTIAYRDQVNAAAGGAEGGGGDYGSSSGGYDQLGFGTALFRRA